MLSRRPKWTLGTNQVEVEPGLISGDRELHYMRTFGSGDFIAQESAEFRFLCDELSLDGILFNLSDKNLAEDSLRGWIDLSSPKGSFRLCCNTPRYFSCDPFVFRSLHRSPQALLSGSSRMLTGTGVRSQVQVAPDLSLLFLDRMFCGFCLFEPIRYLTESEVELTEWERDFFYELVDEILLLFSEDTFDLMDDKDPVILGRFKAIHECLVSSQCNRSISESIQEEIEDILWRFYGVEV